MENESLKLGISFLHDKVRFIEAEELSGFLNIMSIVEGQLPVPLDFNVLGNSDQIPQFADVIDKTLDNLHSDVQTARVAVDRKLAIKKTFAVDKDLQDQEIRSQIEWELEQLLIAPRDEYNVGYEHVQLPHQFEKDIVVFVIVRKALVEYIQNIFRKTRLRLEILDIDLFSSIRSLLNSTHDAANGAKALIDVNNNHLGFSLLVDGNYAVSSELPSKVGDEPIEDMDMAERAGRMQNEIETMLQKIDQTGTINVDHIYLTGEACSDELTEELVKIQNRAAVSYVNPFQNIHRQLNIEAEMLIEKHPERFASAVGMVL